MATIEDVVLLASLSNESVFGALDVERTVSCPVKLTRNSQFSGRNTTQLFASNDHIVKLRTDYVFQDKDVLRRAEASRDQEVNAGVYHPLKTWFFCRYRGNLVIGNITPRLVPVNTAFSSLYANEPDKLLALFTQWFNLYFRAAHLHHLRLDEGLSNFGYDQSFCLYYLDDDLYRWDDFSSLSLMFAVWCRHYPEIDTDFCQRLATALADSVLNCFQSPHLLQVVYGQFRGLQGYSAREKRLVDSVLTVLAGVIKRPKQGSIPRRSNCKSPETPIKPSGVEEQEYQHNDVNHSLGKRVPSANQEAIVTDDRVLEPTGRIAVLADIHANAPALEQVLNDLKSQEVNQLLILGDIVGYGPHPRECIERLQTLPGLIIQGNHDYAAATGDIYRGFSKMAKWAIEWTREQIGGDESQFLESLPPVYRCGNWLAVHGAPMDKLYFYAYVYQMTYQANLDWMASNSVSLAFHGHSHIQSVYTRYSSGDQLEKSPSVNLQNAKLSLICPGSVGQPRCGDWRAEYAIFDSEQQQLDYRKVEYDIEALLADMRGFGFPQPLIDRYSEGK